MLSLSAQERAMIGLEGREKMEREYDQRIVIRRYLDAVRPLVDRTITK